MDGDFQIPKRITDIIVKVCFNTTEFSRLYENDGPNSIKQLFQCNDEILMGLSGLVALKISKVCTKMWEPILKCIETTLEVYNNLKLPFENKKEMITALNNLHFHLAELRRHIHQTYCQVLK
jgi:hypothetical protein